MKALNFLYACIGFFILALLFVQCQKEELVVDDASLATVANKNIKIESAGNNLSFPVIWSDGFAKTLREPPGTGPFLEGEWWYVWAENPAEPTDPVFSCKPHPDNPALCEDGSTPGDGSSVVYKAYLQKDEKNIWQATNAMGNASPVNIDLLDWGDNLESIDWNLRSQVRTELVFYENLTVPVIQYAMRHVSGWGINEVHGLQTTTGGDLVFGPGDLATVYSHNVRFTIQKLLIPRESIIPGSLTWVPNEGWTETDPNGDEIIDTPIFNQAVHEAGDGPGYFNAEVNVKGKIIYGYTWNLRKLNEGEGYYRITYSFDENGTVPLNTFFDENTEIIVPLEETILAEGGGGGGEAQLDVANNLTYMDILIVKKSGGGGGGNGGGGGPQ